MVLPCRVAKSPMGNKIIQGVPRYRAGKTHAGEGWRLTATRQFYLSFVICDSMAAR